MKIEFMILKQKYVFVSLDILRKVRPVFDVTIAVSNVMEEL